MATVEFTVKGPPVSAQSNNPSLLQSWKDAVRTEAIKACAGLAVPLAGPVRFVCVNYYEGPAQPLDDDNMVKAIRDALQGVVYENDRQITDSAVRQTIIDGAFRVRGASAVLLMAFSRGDEFVYIKVEPAPSHAKLLT